MSPLSLNTKVQEVEKLERRWKWQRWIHFVFGGGLVLFGFYAIVEPDTLHRYVAQIPPFLILAVGGAMLGSALGNWRGSKELKLLRKFKAHYKDDVGNT